MLSIVVPCYNEEQAIPLFYTAIERVSQELSHELELLFVDDGSQDQTLEVVKKLSEGDGRIHYLSFSRNFGKEAAIFAGLEHAQGNLVAIMDADLQDPPGLLVEMEKLLKEEGLDCVGTRRVTRKGEPPVRSFFARCFYRFINRLSQTEIVDGARDFRMMKRPMVDAILSIREVNRFSKGIFSWVGFRTRYLEYENVERAAGETKWSFWKLFLYSLEGILAFSTKPLAAASVIGIVLFALAGVLCIFYLVKALFLGDPVAGFPTLVTLILGLGGIQLLCLGIIGQYLAKTYLETKKRPLYFIKEKK